MMTPEEFSNEFDVLAQSYLREGGFTLSDSSLFAFNEYEKSLYLTSEQEKLVIALYSGGGSYGGFELTEQIRRDLETLLSEASVEPSDSAFTEHIVANSQFFKLPKELWYIVYEAGKYADDSNNCPSKQEHGYPVEVVPVTYDEFHRIKGDPFRGPTKRRALRLDKGTGTLEPGSTETAEPLFVEVVPKYPLGKYYIKFIRRPDPIILTDLDGVTINDVSDVTGCKLHSSLHRLILEGAVRAALAGRVTPSQEGDKS